MDGILCCGTADPAVHMIEILYLIFVWDGDLVYFLETETQAIAFCFCDA